MRGNKHRVLIVSGRLLVSQGLVSLLANTPFIDRVDVAESLYDALMQARQDAPDVMVIDLPSGADLFVDRPLSVDGREIKTIVLQEDSKSGRSRLYVHPTGRPATLQSLVTSILEGDSYPEDGEQEEPVRAASPEEIAALMDAPPATPRMAQPGNLMRARASGPSSPRISSSSKEL
jgi:hypothetical protein